MPKISVVIPTYNRAHFIKKAMNSVLEQTYQDFEIVIVDDGSKDNTEEVVQSIKDERIRYIRHEKNKGEAGARNTGIENSKGEYIAFLDTDVTWSKDKLEKQFNILETSPADVGVVFTGVEFIDYKTQNVVSRWIIRENVNEKVFDSIGGAPDPPSMFIRKSAFLDVGLYDENIPFNVDTEMDIRLAKKYKFILIDEFLTFSTVNHERLSNSPDIDHIKGLEIIYEKHKDVLTKSYCYSLCTRVAGNYMLKKDFKNAKKFLISALKYKPYKVKTLISVILVYTIPSLNFMFYKKKYKYQQNKN
jgi:glycosyltransferase involved in cell wall biosynthesis